jgi:hypothetical protein
MYTNMRLPISTWTNNRNSIANANPHGDIPDSFSVSALHGSSISMLVICLIATGQRLRVERLVSFVKIPKELPLAHSGQSQEVTGIMISGDGPKLEIKL